jgi:hypothetical protein
MSDFKIVKLINPISIVLDGVTFRGEYNGATAYSTGDSVSYNGSSYVAIAPGTGNLPTNTTYWQVISQKGDTGATGPTGASFQEEFETVSKNLKSWDATFAYSSGVLNTITYTDGVDTIVKTFNYTGSQLTSIVLSGDTPSGIDLTKTFGYTGSSLTSVSYS